MYWHWNICDKIFYEEFRTNHLQSGNHKRSANSIIGKYIIVNPIRVDETVAEFLSLHYRKYEKKFCYNSGEIINIIKSKKNI